MLLLATAAVLVFYINTPLLYCYPVLKHNYLMRISESKCFLWHGLCLLPQGTTRSLGKRDCRYCCRGDMRRAEVHRAAAAVGQDKPASGTSTDRHNWRAPRAALPGSRAARSLPPHLQKHGDSSRPGIREEFPPSRASRTWDCLLVRVGWEAEKMLLRLSSAISAHCWRGLGLKARLFCSGLHSCKIDH